MIFIVRVWDCNMDTDDPCRTLHFDMYTKAIQYVKRLPAHEGGMIDKKLK